MMKKKLGLILFIILLTGMFTGCNYNIFSGKSNSEKQNLSLDVDSDETDTSTINDVQDDPPLKLNSSGYSYEIYDENGKPFQDRDVHDVKKNKNFKFFAVYSYTMDPKPANDLACTMTVYANYKQIGFFSGDEKNKIDKLDFKVKSDEKIKIPVELSTDEFNGTNKIMIIFQCNEFAGKTVEGSTSYIFDLNVENKTDYKITDKKTTFKSITYPMNGGSHVTVNQNFKIEDEKSHGIEGSKQSIKAKKGQEFPLAFRFGGDNTDGLLLLTIDGNQYKIDGENYLYFGASKNMIYKRCTVKAPEKAGVYSLCAYFKRLPWGYNCNGTTTLSYSHVLKLIVE